MSEFLIVSIGLVLLASIFVLFPLMRNRSEVAAARDDVNVELFSDRMAEIDNDYAAGKITAEEHAQFKTELERRLLEETESVAAGEGSAQPQNIKTNTVLLLVIVAIAALVYQYTGGKPDWEIAETLKSAKHKAAAGENTEADVANLIDMLEARLQQRPNNANYLMMLASTQMELENYAEASAAYQRLVNLFPTDAGVLAYYAQSLYLSSGRKLTDQVMQAASNALSQNPAQPTVLGMLGIANFEQGEYQLAIDYWQRLLPSLGPVSPNRKMIEAGIQQAKSRLGIATSDVPAVESVGAASLRVRVSVGEDIKVANDTVVFVFARAANGPRMPLAVAKLTAGDLPTDITLDDSMAMTPTMLLSAYQEIEVVARIAKNGIANPGPGDVEGKSGVINTADNVAPVLLTIDTVLN